MARANGVIVPVEDGTVQGNTSTESTSSKKNGSTLDKEAFLKLLVAQMKYQDPLEPTSNTEYISQLATFSTLEEMQNMNKTMVNQQGTNLVGKQVVMKVTSESTGGTNVISGFVDYVTIENGKTYLVIEGNRYDIEDLESVVDEAYLEAISMAESFKNTVAHLPEPKDLSPDDKKSIEAVRDAVNAMTGYQQSFLDEDSLKKLRELLTQLAKLEEAEKPSEGTDPDKGTTTGGEGN